MNPQLRDVHRNIARLGLNALAIANYHAHYAHMNETSGLAVLSAAHAAELLIKARIAEEHPLLIFEQLPKSSKNQLLDFEDLFENGRTLDFADLPARLWAATGITIPSLQRYRDFGRLRNAIQHFAAPSTSRLGTEVDLFIFEVIDPFIHACWGLYAVDFNEDTEIDYLMECIVRRKILFLMSPRAGKAWERCLEHVRRHEKIDESSSYFIEMNQRAIAAVDLAVKEERAEKARWRRQRKKHEAEIAATKAPGQPKSNKAQRKRPTGRSQSAPGSSR